MLRREHLRMDSIRLPLIGQPDLGDPQFRPSAMQPGFRARSLVRRSRPVQVLGLEAQHESGNGNTQDWHEQGEKTL